MNPYTINPPESDAAFEKLCLALLKRHWSRPGLERFAKKGEEQFGVDIFDTLGETPLYSAQCKLKEQWKSLEPAEIRGEVEKAKTFPSKLDHYAILTTGKISGAAQLAIQGINQENRAAGLFTVELFTWEKIGELIRQYPEVEAQFYGGLRAEEVAVVSSKLDYIATLTESITSPTSTTEVDALIDEARARINPRDAQIAILLLNRIQRIKGGELSDWHRFRILTNLGAANLVIGRGADAARYFLDARSLRSDDELAVTNEVLAYHVLGEQQEAHTKAAVALQHFPNSTRLRSLWLQSADSDKTYESLLEATSSHMRKEAEVASALARKAIAVGFIDWAVDHALAAVADKPNWSQAHLLLAQTYFGRVIIGERKIQPLSAEDKERTLTKAVAACDEAIHVSEAEGDSSSKAQALALKADIALIKGHKEEAARFARESFAADPTELHGRLALAQASFSAGNFDEAISILEETCARSDSAPNLHFMLGQALMARGTDQDINRAIEVLTSAKIEKMSREFVDPIIIGAIRAIVQAKRFADVPTFLLRPEVAASTVMVATIKAIVALNESREIDASKFLDEAIAAWRSTETLSATDFLARALVQAGRLSDALPLLQGLFSSQMPGFDVGLLLNCAGRLKHDKVILDTCQELYNRGIREWQFVEFEVQYLEEYDFHKAISRLQEFIAANPKHRVAKLRLAIIGMRYGQSELAHISEETLPDVEELPMRYAVPAIHVLQWQGELKLAVDYAYRLLRAHYSELEAHKAYLGSLVPSPPEDMPATMERVGIGSAVQYAEVGDVAVGWFVIEDTNEPSSEFEELSCKSDIARELLGKKVGDSFVLAKSHIKDRDGKILQILSKYTRRFQAVGHQMQVKFGGQSVIETMSVPSPENLTLADVQPMLDSVKARSEAVSRLREIYRSNFMTIHMYADQFGRNAYEGLSHLAALDDDFIRCVPPEISVLANALTMLGTKNSIVLDLTSLATLRLLGIVRQVLASTAFRFVITPATYTELQEMRAQSRFSSAHGTMYYENGQHYFTETDEVQVTKQRALYEEFMQCIEKHMSVVPVPQVASIMPDKRELLEKILGKYGLESALLAVTPGYIWWSDDLVASEIAKLELKTERVWTQAVLEHIATIGLIDRHMADEAYAKLLGFEYQATHFTAAVMVGAIRVANGAIDAFPMRQVVRSFGSLAANKIEVALRVLAEFILKLSLEAFLPETKCIVTRTLLNTFSSDPTTTTQLVSFRLQCARLMALNPIGQADFIKCFDEWRKARLLLPNP